jgi:hypothetical protein
MWGRSKSSSLWTDSCFNRISKLSNNVVIIDDIRFPEEAMAVEKMGGTLIRIEGVQRGPNVDPKSFTSSSECALDNWDFKHRVSNMGTQEETIQQLENILNSEV